jgi:ADP-ribose pyrophosphatase
MNDPLKVLFETKWIKLLQRGRWTFASRRTPGEPIGIDAVSAIAWHTEHIETAPGVGHTSVKRLVVVEEFRVPINGWEIALPAGLLEQGEDPVECAKRELFEETGFLTESVGMVSKIPLFSSAGLTDETSCFVELFCRGNPAEKPGVGGEQIKVHLLDRNGCIALLARAERREVGMSVRIWPILVSIAQSGRFAGQTVA